MAASCQMKYETPICSFGPAYIQGVSIEADRNRVTAISISRAKNFWMYCITFAIKETLNNLLIPVA